MNIMNSEDITTLKENTFTIQQSKESNKHNRYSYYNIWYATELTKDYLNIFYIGDFDVCLTVKKLTGIIKCIYF